MTRAREWQVSLDFKARLDEDAAFDLMEALGRYGASVAVDPGHTGGGLTLAVDAPDGETALDKALTLLEKNMPGATVTGLEAREWADAVAREPRAPIPAGGGLCRDRAHDRRHQTEGVRVSQDRILSQAGDRDLTGPPLFRGCGSRMGADPRAQTRTSESDGIGNDARAPAAARRGVYFLQGGSGRSPMDSSGRESAVTRSGPVGSRAVRSGP